MADIERPAEAASTCCTLTLEGSRKLIWKGDDNIILNEVESCEGEEHGPQLLAKAASCLKSACGLVSGMGAGGH